MPRYFPSLPAYSRRVLTVIPLLVGLSSTAAAQSIAENSARCRVDYDACKQQCVSAHPDDTGKRAPCVAICSGRHAACDAGAAYDAAKPWVEEKIEKAKPWLEEQVDKARKLHEDLMKKYGPGDRPADAPQPRTKENSI